MIEYLPLILTGIGIIASILYYTSVLRNANKTRELQLEAQQQSEQTRQAQIFMQAYARFQDPSFTKMHNEVMAREWDSVEDYIEKVLSEGWDATILSVQSYYEGIGVLMMKGMIDADFVYELMPTMVNTFWSKYEPIVLWGRENLGYPQFWRPIEYLKDRMIEEAEKRGDPFILSYRQE
jgi:hypothetical protein